MDSIRRLPGYRPAHDSAVLLSPARIAARAPALKREWDAYVARSRAAYARDTAAMNAELRKAGRTAMTNAPVRARFLRQAVHDAASGSRAIPVSEWRE